MKKVVIAITAILVVIGAIIGVITLLSNSNEDNAQEVTGNNQEVSNNTENETNINNEEQNNDTQANEEGKILIAFFSKAGENYSVGTVEVGNTEIMAQNIAEITGGDLYKIDPVVEYPDNYNESTQVAQKEQNEDARPEIKTEIENFDQYDIIFIGYPIWWGDMPQILYTFLESYDFSGKTVIPFNTHEGSGNAGTYTTIKNKLSNSTVLDGLAIRGATARQNSSKSTIENWINGLEF